jgi:hypothetical protein
MFAHRIFDHRLIGGDDEGGAVGEYEQADRFERLDGGVGKAAIKIVDQHDQLVDTGRLQQARESLPEGLDLFRNVLRLGRLQQPLHAINGLIVVLLGREFGGIGEDALHGVNDSADLVGCRNARHGGERQTAAVACDLEPIDPAEDICDRRPGLRQQRTLLEQTGDDALDQRDLGVLETRNPDGQARYAPVRGALSIQGIGKRRCRPILHDRTPYFDPVSESKYSTSTSEARIGLWHSL